MEKNSKIAAWLIDECNKQNLSWAEASRRAGVAQNTISQIVNGTPAGPKRLTALADYFGVPHQFIFELAGLLDPPPSEDSDPLTRRYVDELLNIWHELRDSDPDAAQRLMGITIMQAEMVLAAVRANHGNTDPIPTEEPITEAAL